MSQYFAFKDFSGELVLKSSLLVELCAGSEDLILCNKHSCIHFCFSIDGTFSSQLGKFINHSSRHVNCVAKPVKRGNDVYICLFATQNILTGTELRYDYGIRGLDWQKVKNHFLLSNEVCWRYYCSCKSVEDIIGVASLMIDMKITWSKQVKNKV